MILATDQPVGLGETCEKLRMETVIGIDVSTLCESFDLAAVKKCPSVNDRIKDSSGSGQGRANLKIEDYVE